MALVLATFFFASAGASSAYLTVSEIFPMETRALAIALFYAVGTAVGGISGPVRCSASSSTAATSSRSRLGFFIGAGAMALGGIAELFFGVRAEQKALEDIATPLTAEEVDGEPPDVPERRARGRGAAARADRAPASRRSRRAGCGRARATAAPTTPRAWSEPRAPRAVSATPASGRSTARSSCSSTRWPSHGELRRDELARRLDARRWGPGRYGAALRTAIREGRVERGPGRIYRIGSRGR